MGKQTLEQKFQHMDGDRHNSLTRARDAAALTIPSILPREYHNETQQFEYPWQSLGARIVHNLSSRLITALLPPGQKAFKFALDPTEEVGDVPQEDIDQAVVQIENAVHARIQSSNIRQGVTTALDHLIVSGAPALYLTRDYSVRVYRLDQYVCRRNPDGTLLESIMKDEVDVRGLSNEIISRLGLGDLLDHSEPHKRRVTLYTRVVRKSIYSMESQADSEAPEMGVDDDKVQWVIHQEINGEVVGPPKTVTRSPFIFPRWNTVSGEHYGRGHIEDMMGDLRTYEALNRAIVEAAAISSKTNPCLRPGSTADIDELNDAENGQWVMCNPEDVSVVAYGKDIMDNMQMVYQVMQGLENRLAYAGLLNSALSRDAERVTATEIRSKALELEGQVGGVYTALSQELILPLIEAIIDRMVNDESLPEVAGDMLIPIVLTGFESLGREQDLVRVQTFIQAISQLGPEAMQYLNVPAYIKHTANALSLDAESLVRSEQEVQQMRQQQQMAEVGTQAAADIATQAAANANTGDMQQ